MGLDFLAERHMNNMNYKYRFTLFTPCYNSANFIQRVFDSIDGFTFRDFEYIIVNDCSTDNTSSIIKDYIAKVNFPVKYLDRTKNAGLYENIKYALENAEGEFFVCMGHDDAWVPETLELYDRLLKKYDSDNIAGIGALCKTQYGDLVGYRFGKDEFIASCFDVFYEKNKYRVELPLNYKTEIYREYIHRYPPKSNIDLLIGCDYKMIFVNKIIRTYYINENPNRLTARKRKDMANELYLNGLFFVNKFQYKIKGQPLFKLKRKSLFVYYSCLKNNGLINTIKDVKYWRNKAFVVFVYLPLLILSRIAK